MNSCKPDASNNQNELWMECCDGREWIQPPTMRHKNRIFSDEIMQQILKEPLDIEVYIDANSF